MAEELERNFKLELDEIDFDTLVNANLKFNMDIPVPKIRKFLEMVCDEFNDNLNFFEKQFVAIFIKLLITKALASLSFFFFLDWELFDKKVEKNTEILINK